MGIHGGKSKNLVKRLLLVLFIALSAQVTLANDLTKKVKALEASMKQGVAHENYADLYNDINALLETAEGKKDYNNVVRLNVLMADMFMSKLAQPKTAESYLFEASKYVSKCDNENIVVKFMYIFSKQNYLAGNVKGAKKYLHELIRVVPTKNLNQSELKIGAYYHAIGTIWEKEMQLDSARYYYHKSIDLYTSTTDDKSWLFNPEFQLLQIDILEKKSDANIIERIDEQLTWSKKYGRSLFTVRFNLLAAEYYSGTDQHSEFISRLEAAERIVDSLNITEYKLVLLNFYGEDFKKQGDFKRSLDYFEKYTALNDSLVKSDNESQFSSTELMIRNIEAENGLYKAKVQNQEIEAKGQTLLFSLFVAVLIILVIGIIILLSRSKNKKYRELSEINLELKTKEIKHKEEQLGTFATDIIRRSKLMNEIYEELKKVKAQPTDEKRKDALNLLVSKIKNQSYVNKQLVQIQDKVEDINNNYYLKLLEICPSLTSSDKQLCSMIKLDLSQSELAIIFGIETASLKTKKYRLKKKFGLTQDEDLSDYLRSI